MNINDSVMGTETIEVVRKYLKDDEVGRWMRPLPFGCRMAILIRNKAPRSVRMYVDDVFQKVRTGVYD